MNAYLWFVCIVQLKVFPFEMILQWHFGNGDDNEFDGDGHDADNLSRLRKDSF